MQTQSRHAGRRPPPVPPAQTRHKHQAAHEVQGPAGTHLNDLFTKTARQDFFGPDGLSAEPGRVGAELYYHISLEEPLTSGSSLQPIVQKTARSAGQECRSRTSKCRRERAAWRETRDAAGTARALFGVSLVFQVPRQDWDAGMPYLWQAFGLAEAVEESGDLYGRRRSTGTSGSTTCTRTSAPGRPSSS
jgi:hypothetical protein